jgi:hypothetical protein
MSLSSENTIRASQSSLAPMADRDTPFIANAWYVAALETRLDVSCLALHGE